MKKMGILNQIQNGDTHNIVQLKNNYIPVGLIPLKQLFDQKDA
jgi:hypothetical protein